MFKSVERSKKQLKMDQLLAEAEKQIHEEVTELDNQLAMIHVHNKFKALVKDSKDWYFDDSEKMLDASEQYKVMINALVPVANNNKECHQFCRQMHFSFEAYIKPHALCSGVVKTAEQLARQKYNEYAEMLRQEQERARGLARKEKEDKRQMQVQTRENIAVKCFTFVAYGVYINTVASMSGTNEYVHLPGSALTLGVLGGMVSLLTARYATQREAQESLYNVSDRVLVNSGVSRCYNALYSLTEAGANQIATRAERTVAMIDNGSNNNNNNNNNNNILLIKEM